MWWMYLLVAVALTGLGSGAAQALFVTHDLGDLTAAQTCLARQGLSSAGVTIHTDPADAPRYEACAAPFNRRHGAAMLVGAAALPVIAALLTVFGGLVLRWRLRRDGTAEPTAAGRAATARFEEWCDRLALTGRRRPRLRLTDPGTATGRAFTTGVPLTRPVVVVPLGYAYAEPECFDVVVLHELAHVRARDLGWASAVWWAGWLSVPVLLLATSPLLARPALLVDDYGWSLALAVALSLAVLVLRSALLRRRELAADRHAVDVLGTEGPLRTMLAEQPVVAGGRWRSYLGGIIASHPPHAVRAAADPAGIEEWEGGFAVTAATSLVALFTFQAVDVVLVDVLGFGTSDPALATELGFGAASLLWASIVVPAWTRRVAAAARTGSAPTWSGPLAGAVLGVVSGYCLPIPGASTVVGQVLYAGHLPLVAAELVLVTAGVAALAVALATRVAETGRRTASSVAAVVTAADALTTALSVGATVVTAHLLMGSAAEDRTMLAAQGDDRLWRFTPLLVLLGLAATGRLVHSGRRLLPVVAVSALAGGVAAFLSWHLRWRDGRPTDTTYLLLMQRSWICALAGVVAAVVVLPRVAGPRLARLPVALAAGYVTAAVAGLVQFAALAVDGFGRNAHNLQESVRIPMWLLFVVTVAGLPAVLATPALRLPAARSRPGWRRVGPLVGCATAVGALAVALVDGAFAPLTVASHDYERSRAAAARPKAPQDPAVMALPGTAPSNPVDPGRILDGDTLTRTQDGIERLLPPGHRLVANDDAPVPDLSPKACRDMFLHDAAVDDALPSAARLTRTYTVPAPGTTGGITVVVKINSYLTPTDLDDLRTEVARCPHFTVTDKSFDNGRLDATMSARPVPDLPYPSAGGDLTFTGRVRSVPLVTTASDETVLIGHNTVTVDITYTYLGVPPSAAVRQYPGQLHAAALSTAISALRSAPGR